MKRSSRARWSATVAVSALSLALITGCGESGDGASTDAEGSQDSGAAAKALSTAELEKLLLTTADLEGHTVESAAENELVPKSEVEVDKAACEPLAWVTSAVPPGDTDAGAANVVIEEAEQPEPTSTELTEESLGEAEDALTAAFDVDMTIVGLSSYDGDGAEQAMKAVSDAVAECGDGFVTTAAGEETKVTKVTAAEGSGRGDESVVFNEDIDVEGESVTVQAEVVRKGGTVATFFTVNIAALSGQGGATEVPAAVAEAQLAKLK
ncbi:hypothetical protein AB0O01_21485 [Streptomyces sp. NPDC093252]|uniref:hypothetical protein n=1 Tax=Streptomyces sp. NPDC093252 TaxID=3154980 RepID=UPI00342471EF